MYERKFKSSQGTGQKFDINAALNNPEFQSLLLEKMGVSQKNERADAGFLGRLLAIPMAVGSVPDLISKAAKGQNPLTTFAGNLKEGVMQTATGKQYLDTADGQDLLKQFGVLQGRDPLSKAGRFGAGLGIDILTDPLTYVSFGAGGVAKGGATAASKQILKNSAKQGVKSFSDDFSKLLTKQLVGGNVDDAIKALEKKGITNADNIVKTAVRDAGLEKKVGFGLGNKNIDLTPIVGQAGATAINAVANPFGAILEQGLKVGKTYAPEATKAVTSNFNSLFRKGANASLSGYGGLDQLLNTFDAGLDGRVRKTMAEIKPLLTKLDEFSPEELSEIPMMIEGTMPVNGKMAGVVEEIKKVLENRGSSLVEKKLIKEELVNYFPRKALGRTEESLRNEMSENAFNLLTSTKGYQDALAKNNGEFISFDDLANIGKREGSEFAQKVFAGAGDLLGTAGKERTIDTMLEGFDKGIVYDKNTTKVLGEYLINSDKALARKAQESVLVNMVDDFGDKIFRTADSFNANGKVPADYIEYTTIGKDRLYIPKDAANVLDSYQSNFIGDQGTGKLLKAYDTILSTFKKSVTSLGPGVVGYNMRNAIGDTGNMLIGGYGQRDGVFSPTAAARSFKKAVDILMFEKEMAKAGKSAAIKKYGNDVTSMYARTINSGIIGANAGQFADEAGSTIASLEKYNKGGGVLDMLKKYSSKIEGGLGAPTQFREDVFRVANFIDHYEQTGNVVEAAKRAKFSSLDYSNLTPFEKNVAKRVIPFYSFMRQNLELQLTAYSKRPALMTAQKDVFSNLGSALSDSDMTEEDWELLPDWMKNGLSFVVGKDGQNVDVLTGFGDTYSAVDDFLGGTAKGTAENLLGSLTPFAKIPLEMTTGRNFFTGEAIEDSTTGRRYKDYPESIKKLLGYRETTGVTSSGEEYTNYYVDPEKAYLLENTPGVSPYNVMGKRILDAFGPSGDKKYITSLLSGGRIYEKDLTRLKSQQERDKVEELNKILVNYGVATPKRGVYLSPSAEQNSPEVMELLRELGYSQSKITQKEREKRTKQSEQKAKTIEDILKGY